MIYTKKQENGSTIYLDESNTLLAVSIGELCFTNDLEQFPDGIEKPMEALVDIAFATKEELWILGG